MSGLTKIAVGYGWEPPFMYTRWADAALAMETPPGCELKWIRGQGWCSAKHHTEVCEKALEWGADYVCFVGSDQIHPPDMFTSLMENASPTRAVAALVPTKGGVWDERMRPFQPLAFTGEIGSTELLEPNGNRMEKVTAIGSGVLLFPARVLEWMDKPWFYEFVTDESYNRRGNCDVVFVTRLLKEHAIETWVDTAIRVKHLHIFEIDDTWQHWFPSPETTEGAAHAER